jgi:hypothetical protein
VRQRTDLVNNTAYKVNYRRQYGSRLMVRWRNMMARNSTQWFKALSCAAVVFTAGCSSMKRPATADVAVSKEAVANAADSGGAEYAPVEMSSAREKLARANQAMAEKHYKLAEDLAAQAQADAKLAQGKAKSAKAQKEADALQEDIHVLRVELDRANQ